MSKSIKLSVIEVNDLTYFLDQILQKKSFSTASEMLTKATLSNLVHRLLVRSNKMHFEGSKNCTFLVKEIDQITLLCLESFGFLSSFTSLEKTIILKILYPHLYETKHKKQAKKRLA